MRNPKGDGREEKLEKRYHVTASPSAHSILCPRYRECDLVEGHEDWREFRILPRNELHSCFAGSRDGTRGVLRDAAIDFALEISESNFVPIR